MSIRKHAHFHPGMGTKEQIATDLYEVREQRDALLKAARRALASLARVSGTHSIVEAEEALRGWFESSLTITGAPR